MQANIFYARRSGVAMQLPIHFDIQNYSDVASQSRASKKVELQNGTVLNYYEFGDRSKPKLLLIHGVSDNALSWAPIIPYLEKDFHIYAIDQRGHGFSEPDCVDFSLNAYAEDASLFIKQVIGEDVILVGHSMGSLVTQRVAAMIPDYIQNLVLIGSTASSEGNKLVLYLADLFRHSGEEINQETLNSLYVFQAPIDEQFLDLSKQHLLTLSQDSLVLMFESLSEMDNRSILKSIKAPTLLVWGEDDDFFGVEEQKELRAAIQDVEFFPIKNGGHNVHWEHPEIVAQAILEASNQQSGN